MDTRYGTNRQKSETNGNTSMPISPARRAMDQSLSADSQPSHESTRSSSSSANSSGLVSPRKTSTDSKQSQKRKLSETRGVILPDIKIVPNNHVGWSNGQTQRDKDNITRIEIPDTAILSSDSVQYGNNNPHIVSQGSVYYPQTPPMTSSPIGHVLRHPFKHPKSPTTPTSQLDTSTNSMRRRGILTIAIFMPDLRAIQFSIEGGKTANAAGLMEVVRQHMGLPIVLAQEAFSLWMVSPTLEIQLKTHHIPFQIRKYWGDLLRKFTTLPEEEIPYDEPLLVFKRNVLLSKRKQKILCETSDKGLELLFLDARESVMNGKYVVGEREAVELASLDMALTLGELDREKSDTHIRQKSVEFIPNYLNESSPKHWSIFNWAFKSHKIKEDALVEKFRKHCEKDRLDIEREYLDLCMNLPYYGGAYFCGQIERPPPPLVGKGSVGRKLMPKIGDIEVLISISRDYFTVIDEKKKCVLLAVPIMNCSWRKAPPSEPENPSCLPSFFLHFPEPEDEKEKSVIYSNNADSVDIGRESEPVPKSKLLQIFTKQAVMMEALLNSCVECGWSEANSTPSAHSLDDIPPIDASEPNSYRSTDDRDGTPRKQNKNKGEDEGQGTLSEDIKDTMALSEDRPFSPTLTNKLDRLCLATFDQEGNCLEAVGSLHDVLLE